MWRRLTQREMHGDTDGRASLQRVRSRQRAPVGDSGRDRIRGSEAETLRGLQAVRRRDSRAEEGDSSQGSVGIGTFGATHCIEARLLAEWAK